MRPPTSSEDQKLMRAKMAWDYEKIYTACIFYLKINQSHKKISINIWF